MPILAAASVLACLAPVAGTPLLLTPLLADDRLQEARELSKVTIDNISMGHSGYFTVPLESGKRNHMYFWYVPCLECDAESLGSAPLVQWFQGGPGGPSMFGSWTEVGNYYLDSPKGPPKKRCFSWCRTRSCLFVDSPTMTGFSYQVKASGDFDPKDIEYTRTSEEATEQVYHVLTQFLTLFPELQPSPYWITGESYGGNYCAWMAKTVLKHNAAADAKVVVNIKGVSVGDPVLDMQAQWPSYPATLYSMGLVMQDERAYLEEILERGVNLVRAGDCWGAFLQWNRIWNDDGGSSCGDHCEFLYRAFSGSNLTEMQALGTAPASFDYWGTYMNLHAEEFHFSGKPGGSQLDEGGPIYETMVRSGDFCQTNAPIYVQELFLDAGLEVNIYSSNMDPLLGPPTTEAGIKVGLDAAGIRTAFMGHKKTIFRVSADSPSPAGYARCMPHPAGKGGRFCYSIIRNAGHETPAYSPQFAYDMTERFMSGKPLDGSWYDPASPKCRGCGGVPPFAGPVMPECSHSAVQPAAGAAQTVFHV